MLNINSRMMNNKYIKMNLWELNKLMINLKIKNINNISNRIRLTKLINQANLMSIVIWIIIHNKIILKNL